jgi:hypothetical protein
MKSGNGTKRARKNLNKTRLDLSGTKQWDSFFMRLAMEPYSQLGTGERCKAEQCGQPVYDHESGLCSYHRMKEAERAFEEWLRARQQHASGEDRGAQEDNQQGSRSGARF